MTTAQVIAPPPLSDSGLPHPAVEDAPRGPLSDEALKLITAELYRVSAEAIAAFDPDDTLAARLEREWDEVDWPDEEETEEEETEEEPGSLSNDWINPARTPRRQLHPERPLGRFTSSSIELDEWDPSPPPH